MRTMRTIYFMLAATVFVACGRSDSDAPAESATASLQVRFGGGPTIPVEANVTAEATSSRVLLRAASPDVTVLVSLARPVDPMTLTLSETSSAAIVWAKQGADSPLVGVAGKLSVTRNGETLDASMVNIEKPVDGLGTSLWLSGVIVGFEDPR